MQAPAVARWAAAKRRGRPGGEAVAEDVRVCAVCGGVVCCSVGTPLLRELLS